MQESEFFLYKFQNVPKINSISNGEFRPFWSVMIPTRNNVKYLESTLKSVIEQAPGPEEMQIEVIDDCSTVDGVEAMVKEIGKGRISLFKQSRNVGISANFTTCVQRARGHWIHILHDDDMVLPGFYSALRSGIDREQSIGSAFCRWIYIDEDGHWLFLAHMENRIPGIIHDWRELLVKRQLIATPCIVVKRAVYERLGGFHMELSHAADWDMWRRISGFYKVWYEPKPLALYRVHSASDTSRLTRLGLNVTEYRKAIKIAETYLSDKVVARELSKKAKDFCAIGAISTAGRLFLKGEMVAAIAQCKEGLKCSRSLIVLFKLAYIIVRSILYYFYERLVQGRAISR